MPSKIRLLYMPGIGIQYTGPRVLKGLIENVGINPKWLKETAGLPLWRRCALIKKKFAVPGRLYIWRERRGLRRSESGYRQNLLLWRKPAANRLRLRPRRAVPQNQEAIPGVRVGIFR